MGLSRHLRSITTFLGLALLVCVFSRLQFEIPGTGGLKSNFTEVALVLALPFVRHWSVAALLALFAGCSDPDNLLLYGLNHASTYPLLWLAYRRWGTHASTPGFIALWIGSIAAYYFVLLLPATLLLMTLFGKLQASAVPSYWLQVASSVGYEYLATTFVAVFFLLMVRELHIRKETQKDLELRNEELSRHKQLLEAQYDATQEGILVVSDDLRLISWNQRFVEMWLVPQEVLLSGSEARLLEHARELVADPDEFAQTIGMLYADPEATSQALVHLRDGRTLVRFTTAIRYGGSKFPERMWFFRDVTDLENAQAERESLQAKLFQSQKMEAIGQLAGGVAHDFNNSLGVILGAAELAGMGDIPEESRSYLDMIATAARRASSLTRKLLSFSRQGVRNMGLVDARAIVQDTVSLLQSSIDRRIGISLEARSDRSLVRGDKGLLQNALMNLGINASHAMPEGGRLSFELRDIDLDPAYCDSSPFKIRPGKFLEIAVHDTGSGIPPEHLSKIFEPFFTTKEDGKGTGLGLASVYGTVQDHGGALSVYSEVGTGTVFRIQLPLPEDDLERLGNEDAPAEAMPAGTGTILLVDDEDMIRRTSRRMLEGLGYTVVTASDGIEAMALLGKVDASFDLVLLDMIMPNQGGRETFEAIRTFSPSLPVIVCSGFSKPGDLEAMRHQGVSGFLEKPYGRQQLANAVAAAILKPSHPR